jgi:chromosome segregation ATPase
MSKVSEHAVSKLRQLFSNLKSEDIFKEVDASISYIPELLQDIQSKSEEIDALKAKIVAQDAEATKAVENANKEHQETHKTLTSQFHIFLTERDGDTARLQTRVSDLERTSRDANQEANLKEKRVQKLETEKKKAYQALDVQTKQATALREDITKAKSDNKAKQGEIEALNKEMEKEKRATTKLRETVTNLKNRESTLKQELDRHAAQLRDIESYSVDLAQQGFEKL